MMNRRDFLKCGAGLVVSLPVVAAASQTKPQSTTLENRSHAEEAMHDDEQMELSALLDAMVWDHPQLIYISGRYAHFEKVYLANEIGKRIHRLHLPYIIDDRDWITTDARESAYQAMKLAGRCFDKRVTTICLPLSLSIGMRYMAGVIFEVGYGTKDNGVYAGLAKNRWTPTPLTGTVVKLGTTHMLGFLPSAPKDFLVF